MKTRKRLPSRTTGVKGLRPLRGARSAPLTSAVRAEDFQLSAAALAAAAYKKSTSSPIAAAPAKGQRTCVLLLSGGLDSATCLALVSRWRWKVHALSFDYGQRHRVELRAARALAREYRVASHRVIAIPAFGALGGSALTDRSIRVPKKAFGKARIPVTYVPARNTLFLAFALGVAEASGATEIVIGANALDYSGYPDCRREFLRAFERVAKLGTKAGTEGRSFSIRAPLLHMSKADIVRLALAVGLDTRLTTSCYDPGKGGRRCGGCDSCLLRAKGFAKAGVVDAQNLHTLR